MNKPVKQSSGQEPASFEKALAELEKVVAQMEAGILPHEQSHAAQKRGLELAAYCQEKLASAEQQVKVLEGDVLKKLAAAAETGQSDD